MAESDLHKKLKDKGYEYLSNKGYRVAKREVSAGYYGIYDVWGMHPKTLYAMGIEVKVSRSDWKSAKYKDYRCEMYKNGNSTYGQTGANEIYYLCPAGLIQPEEVAPYAGLLWYLPSGRLSNKKKPFFIKTSMAAKIRTLMSVYEPFFSFY